MLARNRVNYARACLSDGKPWSTVSLAARVVKMAPPEELAYLFRQCRTQEYRYYGRPIPDYAYFATIDLDRQKEIGARRLIHYVVAILLRQGEIELVPNSPRRPRVYRATAKLLRDYKP